MAKEKTAFTILAAFNHVVGKILELGEEYTFCECMPTHRYRATIEHIDPHGERIRMDLKITKPGWNERYTEDQEITRFWDKDEVNSGTTLIYKDYVATDSSVYTP